METTYTQITLGSNKLQLIFEEGERRIKLADKTYDRLEDLTRAIPELSDIEYLHAFVKVANFLFSGMCFEVIEDILEFRKKYELLIKEDSRVAEFGKFDTSVLHPPKAKDGQVVFYVEEIATGLPFKVACPFPYQDPKQPFSYSILPY